ncbi:MAG TPA: ABC transporter permease [Bryobacteraceae bacterium]|nr:ABC transporter permease [Bryobacteraceae bacterium]
MRRILSQARKELTQLVRDPLALALALVLPLILLLLLSTAISLTVHNLPIVIQDLDATAASRRYADAFRASISFHVVSWPTDRKPEEALTANRARGVLIIPANFGHDLARGDRTQVQLLVDATDSNTARIVQGYVNQVTNAFNQSSGGMAGAALVGAQVRLWYNPGRDSLRFYSPGVFVMGISMFPALLAALAMAKEGEQKTILQVYVSSISAHEFLLGKIFAYMVIAGCEWILGMCALLTVFGQHIAGDPTPLIVGSVLYAFCVASFGTFVGAGIPNQAAAIQAVALGGFLLVYLLSGLIFPVENIPAGLRWVSNIVWGRYYIELVRDALLEGGGWPAMWFRVFMIAVLGAFFYTMAWLSMRRMQVNA